MTEQQVRDFLAQFDQAREDFKTWPQWMQDAAVERAASFPMPPKDGVEGMPSDCERINCRKAWAGGKKCPAGTCEYTRGVSVDAKESDRG
jgi:hypothetical protein